MIRKGTRVRITCFLPREDIPRVGKVAWIDSGGRVAVQPDGHPAQGWVIVYRRDVVRADTADT